MPPLSNPFFGDMAPGHSETNFIRESSQMLTLVRIISTKSSVYFGDFEVHECIGITANMVDPRHYESVGVKNNMADSPRAAIPPMIVAMPQTPGKKETSNVPIVQLSRPHQCGWVSWGRAYFYAYDISSVMMVKPNQLGFMSALLNIQGTQFQGSYMPNPGWQLSSKEQLLQDQLQREHQEFQAWKLEMRVSSSRYTVSGAGSILSGFNRAFH